MDDVKSIREQLYTDVWDAPMTTVAKKYNLSDTGVRKKCKSLNIPVPPFGYWLKKKAGKEVSERPPLPPYNEMIFDNDKVDDQTICANFPAKEMGAPKLCDLEGLQIEQVSALHGLDLLVPESREYFNNLIESIVVPDHIINYDYLISSHKTEIEYREVRDKAYPFRDDHIKLWTYRDKINERDNISVLPIEVSSGQISRAYRIADTIIKVFRKLKSNISVINTKEDNIFIQLLSSKVSFEISESKTKRRHFVHPSGLQEFRPLYEEIYDGIIHIRWKLNGYEEYSYYSRFANSKKEQSTYLEYSDLKDNPLENQISLMILEIYIQCCENELKHSIEEKKRYQQYEREEEERLAQEEAQKMRKLEEKKQAQINSLVNGILEQSNNWFKHEQLSKYANELDKYLASCSDAETVRLLHVYIRLVRKTADELDPLNDIINEMRVIEE